jgi:Zn-dependent M32 family carboxypeptidase
MRALTLATIIALLLPAPPARAAEETEPNLPLCLKTDTEKWWENAYCQTKTNADDHEAPVFKKCLRQYRKNKAVPRTTCKKIRWLKARACAQWKKSIKPEEYTECLRAKGFPKRVDQNYEYYFGG